METGGVFPMGATISLQVYEAGTSTAFPVAISTEVAQFTLTIGFAESSFPDFASST